MTPDDKAKAVAFAKREWFKLAIAAAALLIALSYWVPTSRSTHIYHHKSSQRSAY